MIRVIIALLFQGYTPFPDASPVVRPETPAHAVWTGQLAYSTDKTAEVSPLDAHTSLITINRNLKRALIAVSAAAGLFLIAGLYWRKKLGKYKRREEELFRSKARERGEVRADSGKELETLRAALNDERAKVVKHQVQKRELLAYIEELKSLQGNMELRHKTVQIHRIFADQKTDDIVNKVENTARTLYPELVEAIRKRYPELNKLEMQYCMMLTLGYNLDEVMSILGRSEKAIKSLRYRIRKKMQLDETYNLRDFILEMNSELTKNQPVS